MRRFGVLCCLLAAGCGDNRAAPDARLPSGSDGSTDSSGDAPGDGPQNVPIRITNLIPAGGSVVQRADFGKPLVFKPDGTAVAVIANYNSINATSTRNDAYVVQLDGSDLKRLEDSANCANTGTPSCDIERLAWTADGATLFAIGDVLTNNVGQAFRLDPTTSDQTPELAVDVVTSGDLFNLFAVPTGADATTLWVVGDYLTNNDTNAGAFDSAATLPVVPSTVIPTSPAVVFDGTGSTDNVFDARGDKIAFVADTTTAGQFELDVADANGSNVVTVVPFAANVEITSVALSPDGTKVAFTMDGAQADNAFDLYIANTDGTGSPVRVSPDRPAAAPTPALLNVFFQVEWSADSKFLAYSADLVEDKVDQAYVVDTTVATPVSVELLGHDDIPAQSGTQGVRGKLLFDSADNIYFRARVTLGLDNFTMFVATPAGVRTEIPMPLRSDSTTADVGAFGITPDGQTLVFSADAPHGNVYDLYTLAL